MIFLVSFDFFFLALFEGFRMVVFCLSVMIPGDLPEDVCILTR